jgi:hypothetical protein
LLNLDFGVNDYDLEQVSGKWRYTFKTFKAVVTKSADYVSPYDVTYPIAADYIEDPDDKTKSKIVRRVLRDYLGDREVTGTWPNTTTKNSRANVTTITGSPYTPTMLKSKYSSVTSRDVTWISDANYPYYAGDNTWVFATDYYESGWDETVTHVILYEDLRYKDTLIYYERVNDTDHWRSHSEREILIYSTDSVNAPTPTEANKLSDFQNIRDYDTPPTLVFGGDVYSKVGNNFKYTRGKIVTTDPITSPDNNFTAIGGYGGSWDMCYAILFAGVSCATCPGLKTLVSIIEDTQNVHIFDGGIERKAGEYTNTELALYKKPFTAGKDPPVDAVTKMTFRNITILQGMAGLKET